MTKGMSWNEAIQEVLKEAGTSLHYTEITQRILDGQLTKSVGATPIDTVATVLAASLKKPNSPYQRLGRGEYALKEALASPILAKDSEGDESTGALQAFGVYWRRDQVNWISKPALMGKQGDSATPVDFSKQIGVYLLYDRDKVIYVGRADDSLLSRLKAHTTNRLGGRWDRFSWFGLRGVLETGKLSEKTTGWPHKVVIDTLEALLIETMEPPLNRRRGDKLEGKEYQQVVDPEIEKRKLQAHILDALGALNS
jgi:hypothetical protein